MNNPTESADSDHTINVLLIEDNSDYAEMVSNILASNQNVRFKVIREESLGGGLTRLMQNRFDVILLDMNLGDSIGLDTLKKTIAGAPDLPIVILTGYADETQAIQALHFGAQDYLIKGQNEVSLVARAIRYAIERKRVLTALKESDARFRRMIEKNADPIIIIDPHFVIRFTNPAVDQLFGRKSNELVGTLFGFPIPQKGGPSEIEIVDQRGKTIVAEMRVVPIQWESEVAYLASLRDITDHKRMLAELEQTRRQDLQMKDVFLSKVSHELRSPLSVVHQFTTILLDGISGMINSEQQENLEIILRNVEELRKMIDDLLQVTRAEINAVVVPVNQSGPQKISVVSECIRIQDVIHETLNMLRTIADKNSISLSTNVAPDLPAAHADPHRIRQVLNNLINNAVKFTPPNGAVHVRSQIDDEDASFIRVTVEDTGPGIPATEKGKIFEYLYQLDTSIDERRKGLGIGLYICREIVEQHQGRIWVDGRPGGGSEFHFTLPIYSLEKLLIPVLTSQAASIGHVGLVVVDIIADKPHALAGKDGKIFAEVWNLLNLCVLPDFDLVLPRIGHWDGGEVFFIVACSPSNVPKGVEALIRRIRAHLRQQTSLREMGMTVDITSLPIEADFCKKKVNCGAETKKITEIINEYINNKLVQRRGSHGQQKDTSRG